MTQVSALALAAALGATSACQEPASDVGRTTAAVVYGDDDRSDVYDHSDPVWAAQVEQFTVALVLAGTVDESNPADVTLIGDTLQEAYGLCAGERFLSQTSAARCSGTLIGPDLVVTSGQCIDDDACAAGTVRFVFDYLLSGPSTQENISSADDVYDCAQVIDRSTTANLDYALVQLDRPVVGRTPAVVRRQSAPLPVGQSLYVHGFPLGLPLKIDDGGTVRDGREVPVDYFVANLDTFTGSTGSGVFDQATGELVGVVARGEADFVQNGDCMQVKMCQNDTCAGEDVTYIFRALESMCGDATCDPVLEGTGTCVADCGEACGDGSCNGGEDPVSCSEDCGLCGDDTCSSADGENRDNCFEDCQSSCGDGTCETAIGESSINCPADCGAQESCGDLLCDEEAGEDSNNCCNDCGCDDGLLQCLVNECKPKLLICNNPGEIDLDDITATDSLVVSIPGETFNGLALTSGSCGIGNSPERTYSFTLTGSTRVDARVDSDFDSVIYLRDDCVDDSLENELACNDDGNPSGNGGARVVTTLPEGTYHLYVDGQDGDSGDYTLRVEFTLDCTDNDPDEMGNPVGDGVCDDTDQCPNDPNKGEVGLCGCGVAETDRDNDSVPDCIDECPDDQFFTVESSCGCGTEEVDCPDCDCQVGRGGSFDGWPAGFFLALLALFALRRRDRFADGVL